VPLDSRRSPACHHDAVLGSGEAAAEAGGAEFGVEPIVVESFERRRFVEGRDPREAAVRRRVGVGRDVD
jgi:hypothetical protein